MEKKKREEGGEEKVW